MSENIKVGSFILKEDVVKLGEEKWNRFRNLLRRKKK